MLEKTLESPLDCKEIQPVHPKGNQSWEKDWCWSWNSNPSATWCKELTHWKRPWCWERLKAGGEGDDRGWDGWMAPLTQWTGVWVSSGNWWNREAWCAAIHGVAKSWTRLSNWTELTDTKAEAPIFWPPDAKSQLTGKDPDAGKDWRQKEKREAEDEMVT